jgi:hypothetical protein
MFINVRLFNLFLCYYGIFVMKNISFLFFVSILFQMSCFSSISPARAMEREETGAPAPTARSPLTLPTGTADSPPVPLQSVSSSPLPLGSSATLASPVPFSAARSAPPPLILDGSSPLAPMPLLPQSASHAQHASGVTTQRSVTNAPALNWYWWPCCCCCWCGCSCEAPNPTIATPIRNANLRANLRDAGLVASPSAPAPLQQMPSPLQALSPVSSAHPIGSTVGTSPQPQADPIQSIHIPAPAATSP